MRAGLCILCVDIDNFSTYHPLYAVDRAQPYINVTNSTSRATLNAVVRFHLQRRCCRQLSKHESVCGLTGRKAAIMRSGDRYVFALASVAYST